MPNGHHDEEFKRKAVELLVETGRRLGPLARELGVSPRDLKQWRRQYLAKCPRSVFAIACFLLGLLALLGVSVLTKLPGDEGVYRLVLLFSGCGLVAAIVGIRQTNPNRPRKKGHGYALAGFAVNLLLFVLFGVAGSHLLPGSHEPAHRSSCQNNLKQMGIVFKLYADGHEDGIFPPLSSRPGRLMFDNGAGSGLPVYPEILSDLGILGCPKDEDVWRVRQAYADETITTEALADALNDFSYFYLGYVVTSDTHVEAFAEAYRERIANGEAFDDDLVVPAGKGNAGGDTIYRLREGIERRYVEGDPENEAGIAKAASEVPVLIERPGNHEPGGGNILYLDGHVEFIKYPGEWPMTEKTMGILNALDAMGKE